jgi:hypothetical protein
MIGKANIISVLDHSDICYDILLNIKPHMALEIIQGKNAAKCKTFWISSQMDNSN